MKITQKFYLFIFILLITFSIFMIVNSIVNFRYFSLETTRERAEQLAQIVRDGLTAHMVNDIMDKRSYFLDSITQTDEIENLWISRSQKVIDQYGPGLHNEVPHDKIDEEVLRDGKTRENLSETKNKVTYRITIPYIADKHGDPNCLTCHQVKEGDVLGAVTLVFDITNFRWHGITTLMKIGAITVLFLFLTFFIVKWLTGGYIDIFNRLKHSLERAIYGDFNHKVPAKINAADLKSLIELYNRLIEKFQTTIGTVENRLSCLIKNPGQFKQDPLEKASSIIHLLSDIQRFKSTIEKDTSLAVIYDRLAHIIEEVTACRHFIIFGVDTIKNEREILYNTIGTLPCNQETMDNANLCRAVQTQDIVDSDTFKHVCWEYKGEKPFYLCIPLVISDDYRLIFMLQTETQSEMEHFKTARFALESYLENAKPVIESRRLNEKLKEKSLTDGLTGLYNRKFLEEFIDKVNKQAVRQPVRYAVLMLDIDHFKMVNDTYGHEIGDQFIKTLSNIIQHDIRASDIAARYGGEEFVLMLHECTEEGAVKVAEKIRKDFAESAIYVGSQHIHKTVSIGISFYPEHAKLLREAIKYADIALYRAKETGRNRVVVFDESMHDQNGY